MIFGELEDVNSKLDSIDKKLDVKFDAVIEILKEIREILKKER